MRRVLCDLSNLVEFATDQEDQFAPDFHAPKPSQAITEMPLSH